MADVFNPSYQTADLTHTSALAGFLIGAAIGVAGAVYVASVVFTGGATLAAGCMVVGLGMAGTGFAAKIGGFVGSHSKSVKGKIVSGSPDVFYGTSRYRAARAELDGVTCSHKGAVGTVTLGLFGSPHGSKLIATGAAKVMINGYYAARQSDKTECGGELSSDVSNVFIGGPTFVSPTLTIGSEIPGWMDKAATGLIVVGFAIAFEGPGLIAAFTSGSGWTAASAVFWFVGSNVAGELGGKYGRQFGEWTGLPGGGIIGECGGSLLGALSVSGVRRTGNRAVSSFMKNGDDAVDNVVDDLADSAFPPEFDEYGNRTEFFDKNGNPTHFTDPLTNKTKPLFDINGKPLYPDDPITIDHIFPQSRIKGDDRFKLLTPKQQKEILDLPENKMPLPRSINSSKNNRVIGSDKSWETLKGQELDPDYADWLNYQQDALDQKISGMMDDMIKSNNG